MQISFHYSESLHNIPLRKLQEQIESIVAGCEVCSKLDKKDGLNGICRECNIQIKAVQRFYNANIPTIYWTLSMEQDFIGYKPLLDKYNEMIGDLPKVFSEGKSYLVSGQHGVGKSMMSCCWLKKIVLKGYTGSYCTLSDMVAAMTGSEYTEQLAVRKQLQMVDGLVIDEFDQRFISSENSNNLFARSLESIIRARLSNALPTIIISNSPNIIETLSGQMKDSLGSLFALVEKVVVLGKDARKDDGK